MKLYFAAAVAAVAISSSASAHDFNGPFVSAGVTLDNVQGSGDAEGNGASGIGGTVSVGYDLATSANTFVGVEANADVYSVDIDAVDLGADWGWSVSGRAGLKLNQDTGAYVRVGYARARVSAGNVSDWGDAVRYGAGLETSVSGNLSLRAEFTQFNYEQDVINNQGAVSLVYGF